MMQNPEAKLLVVVGNSHRKGVEETINNPLEIEFSYKNAE